MNREKFINNNKTNNMIIVRKMSTCTPPSGNNNNNKFLYIFVTTLWVYISHKFDKKMKK